MRAPISVVIPTLNAEAHLGKCLAALMPGLEAGLIRELIISDGGSEDATVAAARAWGAEIVTGPASRGGQLVRGCAAASGDWLLILHADTVLRPGWAGPAIAHLETGNAGWFRLAFAGGGLAGRVVAGWANLRSRLGLPYGDQGMLLPRPLYDTVGGYKDQPLMEDVALARALKGRLVGIDAVAETSAARYQAQGWVRRGLRNLWTLARYFSGVSPQRLADSYRR
ncbi:TIGR04283 family arsenosugar biosynthesis glycosyltransferase [uncultured Roseobacter sp.]|uniref:TIGR04283 family arsenosugar biosynthesis glycosyltransferase n=1 Tax=uncultured Roseobacter sp. TaxID=114847 RepID=UPI002636BB39|nr:TIGR04283 family arsenosugar biosynthesis glycosyltransferase [uncultured Roseobacter sp.]